MSTHTMTQEEAEKQPLEVLFEAMYHGKWSFTDFIKEPVANNITKKTFKKDGKVREVIAVSEKLKIFQDFLSLFLLDFLPLNEEIVFSYRKGVSAYNAVLQHSSSKFFYTCDISNFFHSIDEQLIRKTINTGFNLCPISDIQKWEDRIVELVCFENRLPLGFSTSPKISNSALNNFDTELQEYCRNKEIIYTRYADDIIVSSKNIESLENIKNIISDSLQSTTDGKLSINFQKSRNLRIGSKIKLLGMVILPNGLITIDSSLKKEIEVMIFFYLNDRNKFTQYTSGNLNKAESKLSGLLNYVNTIDQSYLNKLRKKFGTTVIDFFLHRSFGI